MDVWISNPRLCKEWQLSQTGELEKRRRNNKRKVSEGAHLVIINHLAIRCNNKPTNLEPFGGVT
jgi:hypothetical protein